MSCRLHKALLSYYKQLHSLYDEWLKMNKQIDASLTAFTDQKETLRLISDDAEYDEADFDKELRHRLMFNILMVLDEEQNRILKIVLQFNRVVQNLTNVLYDVIQARSKVSVTDEEMKPLIKGSHCRPKLDLLMEWAIKSFEYFNKLYHLFSSNKKMPVDMDELHAALKEADQNRTAITRILACTQYMLDEESLHGKRKESGIQTTTDPAMQRGTK